MKIMWLFLLLICLFILFWPQISRWLRRLMARCAEAMLRRAMGMPPQGKREKGKGEKGKGKGNKPAHDNTGEMTARRMKKVAEDVEYVEIKEFTSESETIIRNPDGSQTRVRTEEQVTDVEYTEIRNRK